MGAPLLVASLGARDAAGAAADARELPPAIDLVEVRLDRFAEPDAVDLVALAAALGRPAMCTLRSRAEGGGFGGGSAARRTVLSAADAAGFAWIDVEEEDARSLPRGRARRIVSWHGAIEREAGAAADEARERVAALAPLAAGGDVVKVAAPAKDAAAALAFVHAATAAGHAAGRPVVAIAIGAAGRCLRPLAGMFAMPLVYVAAHPSRRTALGQVTVREFLDVYRATRVGPATRVFAVAGADVAASLSPAAHNAGFRARGLDAVYVDVSTGSFAQVAEVARRLPLDGLSVTAPFKRDALAFSDAAEDEARSIGAANTLVRQAGGGGAVRFHAANTDGRGFLAAIDLAVAAPDLVRDLCVGNSMDALVRLPLDEPPQDVARPVHSALVYGSGGAARAIAWSLRRRGVRVAVTGRSFESVTAMVLSLGGGIEAISPARAAALGFELLVKATPDLDEDFPVDLTAARKGFAADVVSRPIDTPFLRRARAFGLAPVPGLLMFAGQALGQALRFTGAKPADAPELRATIAAALAAEMGR